MSTSTPTPLPPSSPVALADATQLSGVELRRQHRGLLGIHVKVPVATPEMLAVVYTPGVAKPCLEIQKDPLLSFDATMRGNTLAVLSNGTSVYGLGNAGALAAVPMLETKSVLYKTLAGVDAIPMAIDTQDSTQFVETARLLAPTFGAFHLDGISSPQCFVIEEKLKRALNIPVMHGEHSIAVVVVAGLINACKVVGKRLSQTRIVIHGAGMSGIATARLLLQMGMTNLHICDEYGQVATDRHLGMDWLKSELARLTNPTNQKASLQQCLEGADIYIGYKDNYRLDPNWIKAMATDPIVFALSLPSAELTYDEAKQAGAAVVATQMNDWPNTVSVAMAYPGILRGAMDVKATRITSPMLVAAALALSGMIGDDDLTPENVLPKLMGDPAAPTVARAVAQAAIEHNVAQTLRSPQSIEKRVQAYLAHGSEAWVAAPAVPAPTTADEQAMELRRRYQGVLEIKPLIPMLTQELYSHVYAKPQAVKACQAIYNNPAEVYELTCKSNLVAVITDGSAVLGLGNIGSGAGLPVMEGKAVLFKAFGGVEAFPVCLQTQNVDELLRAIKHLTPMFGGINLEDISAPRCFELEERLIAETDIPIFHDDQHGTAIVTVAAILNAAKAVNKALPSLKIVVNGAGASALSVTNLLLEAGVQEIVVCDTQGAIYEGRPNGMNPFKSKIALLTNRRKQAGPLADHLQGADVVIGLSVPGAISQDMVRSMAADPIIMAMANPTPEIMPHEAKAAGARIIATGRSDFPNQVNNCLAFPGLFRGALDVRAKVITNRMKLAAAQAIASVVSANEWEQGVIIPSLFNPQVGPLVARAVAATALAEGQARRSDITPEQVHDNLANFLATGQLRIL